MSWNILHRANLKGLITKYIFSVRLIKEQIWCPTILYIPLYQSWTIEHSDRYTCIQPALKKKVVISRYYGSKQRTSGTIQLLVLTRISWETAILLPPVCTVLPYHSDNEYLKLVRSKTCVLWKFMFILVPNLSTLEGSSFWYFISKIIEKISSQCFSLCQPFFAWIPVRVFWMSWLSVEF